MQHRALLPMPLLAIAGAAGAVPNAAVQRPIRAFATAFNRGDVAGAKATALPTVAIVDEVPPSAWSGNGSVDRWRAAPAEETAAGKSGGKVTLGTPIREKVAGDHAYVIAPNTYRFTQGGVLKQEVSRFIFAPVRRPAGWKIAS